MGKIFCVEFHTKYLAHTLKDVHFIDVWTFKSSSFLNPPIDNKPTLVWIMAWRWIDDKPLSELMLIRFTDAYMRHLGDMIWAFVWLLFKRTHREYHMGKRFKLSPALPIVVDISLEITISLHPLKCAFLVDIVNFNCTFHSLLCSRCYWWTRATEDLGHIIYSCSGYMFLIYIQQN